jgi:hypothetical protein
VSAETLTAVPGQAAAPRRPGRAVCPAAGMLADGTVFYAPIGEVVIDDERVICHLCGRSLRSVTAHLRVHGWTPGAYREAFGLERASRWKARAPASSGPPRSPPASFSSRRSARAAPQAGNGPGMGG